MKLKLEKRPEPSRLMLYASPVGAVIVTMIVGAIIFSIIGYDDVGPARWTSYGITTMSQPLKRMVEATVNILMDQISSGEIEAEHRILSGDLIVRTSARLPTSGVVEVDGRRIYKPSKA